MTQPIIVLDRDGVINQDSDAYIKTAAEWQPIAGSVEAIARLCQSGFQVAVATNQSGLARGLFDEYILAQIHEKMQQLIEAEGGSIAAVCYCPHLPDADCGCRKPRTGLLERIQDELQTPLAGRYFIGDSHKDLQAAVNFGMQPVLVRTGKGAGIEDKATQDFPDLPVFNDLAQAVIELGLEQPAASLE